MNGVERILGRALEIARAGMPNPHYCLILAEQVEAGDGPQDQLRAMLALMDAAGGSLVRWYEPRRPAKDTVALLEETLFRVQMG